MRIYFVLIAVLIFVPKEDGIILTSPQNEAVESGNQIKLECASNSTNGLTWQFTAVGSTLPITIINNCVLNPAYDTIYSVEIIDDGSCNIVVLAASVNEVGTYDCTSGFDPTQQAQLVVLDSKPNCPVLLNGGNTTDLVAGETVTMICTVGYSTNLSPPAAKWTDPQDQPVPGLPTELPMDGNFYSYINITSNRFDIQPYSIMIYFLPPNNTPSGAASNAPNYTYNWTSDVIEVLYPPSQPNITETPADFSECEASNLICASCSNPSPDSFQWVDLTHNIVTNGQSTIIAEYGSIFICTAINTIREIKYNNSANYSASSATDNSCRFPYPENINISNKDCADDDICLYNCPDVLTCYVDTYPPASYVWIRSNSVHVFNQTIRVSENGNYTCQAYIDGLNLKANKTIEVKNCNDGSDEAHGLSDAEIAGIVVGCVATANLMMTIVFLIIYTKNKDDYNATFSFLEKMLPSLNNSKDHLMSKILWTILSILIAVSIGIIILPVIMIKVTFCNKGNKD